MIRVLRGNVQRVEQMSREPADLTGQHLDEEPVGGRLFAAQLLEPVTSQAARLRRFECNRRCRAFRTGCEQRLVAEHLSRSEHGEGGDVAERGRGANGDMALFDQVQGVARVALVEHDLTPLESAAPHLGEQPFPILDGQHVEQMAAGRHRRTLPRASAEC